MVRFVVLFSGKRKSGKDYCCSKLQSALRSKGTGTTTVGVSHGLKEEYARIHDLDYNELISDGPFKEQHRKAMIVWGEEVRARFPAYFCSAAMKSCSSSNASVVLVSDCRRPTDLSFFESDYSTLSVRVECPVPIRQNRGFVFVEGIDDADSECALDNYKFDFVIVNDGSPSVDKRIEDLVIRITEAVR